MKPRMKLNSAAAAVFGLAGSAMLVGLGVWQLQRLDWKEDLIARLEARLAADPAALPRDPDPQGDAFLRVRAEGEIGSDGLHVLTSLRPYGPGFRVIAPLTLADGRRLMADLGYIPQDRKEVPREAETGAVTGALYWPDETDYFTPEPDRAANIWFARDLLPMAEALQTEPLLIVAESHTLGDWPIPRRLGVNLPNDHLQYAITWFSLALIWAVMSAMLVRRERLRL